QEDACHELTDICRPHHLSFEIVDLLEHVVRSLNGFGVYLVGALCLNHGHHLTDDVYIRAFHITLQGGSEPIHAGIPELWWAAGLAFCKYVAAETYEPRGVRESCQLYLKGAVSLGRTDVYETVLRNADG